MCTLSCRYEENGYTLSFNRDEQKSRAPATPPALFTFNDTRYLSPTDTQAGGTWIWLNEHGLSAAILNHYESNYQPDPEKRMSRGNLLKKFVPYKTIEDASDALKAEDLSPYPPFYIVFIQTGKNAKRAKWDGRYLELKNLEGPRFILSTSSYKPEEVCASRHALFDSIPHDADQSAYLDFHKYQNPEDSYSSVCMQRDDAQTVSLTTIAVHGSDSEMTYEARALEAKTFEDKHTLKLKA